MLCTAFVKLYYWNYSGDQGQQIPSSESLILVSPGIVHFTRGTLCLQLLWSLQKIRLFYIHYHR